MPVPFPQLPETLTTRPDAAEVAFIARGLVSAATPGSGMSTLQSTLIATLCESMTSHTVDPATCAPIGAEAFAEGLRLRDQVFRTRIVHLMLIAALVAQPLQEEVCERLSWFAAELGIDDGMLKVVQDFAHGAMGLALIDIDRNGYVADWKPQGNPALHTTTALDTAWALCADDPALAARWRSLADLPAGTPGRGVHDFYQARGFIVPGLPGSAPPLLAQHDWVHVLADYGTCVESELEVFAFIARASADPRAFSLLAMVVSLFETGYLPKAAGLFEADRGHLSKPGMAVRLADAMRRGALTSGDPEFLHLDWFALADRPVEVLRAEFGIISKARPALAAGAIGPWEPGGISPFQLTSGAALAETEGRPYDSHLAGPT